MIRRSYMDLFEPICNNKNNLALHKYSKNNITSTENVRIFFFLSFFLRFKKKCVGKDRFTGCYKTIKELNVCNRFLCT